MLLTTILPTYKSIAELYPTFARNAINFKHNVYISSESFAIFIKLMLSMQ